MVLGKGPPGGSWHRMDPNLRTLSLSTWMSLPGCDFSKWDELYPATRDNSDNEDDENNNCDATKVTNTNQNNQINKKTKSSATATKYDIKVSLADKNNNSDSNKNGIKSMLVVPRRNLSVRRQCSKEVQTRALVSRVAKYYEWYVHEMGLAKYFMNDTEVTAVLPLHGRTIGGCGRYRNARWLVIARHANQRTTTMFVCRNLVLATGASDLANRLGVPYENERPWVKHDLTQLEDALRLLPDDERKSKCIYLLYERIRLS